MIEAIVSVRGFSGDTTDRQLTTIYTSVRCAIGSARTETAAFHENVPLGQLYEFAISDYRIIGIPDGAEITITNPQTTGLIKGSKFVVVAKTQRQRMAGRFFITGACYLKE